MLLGALLDLGADLEHLRHELAKLNLSGWFIEAVSVMRGGISAQKVIVKVAGVEEKPADLPLEAMNIHTNTANIVPVGINTATTRIPTNTDIRIIITRIPTPSAGRTHIAPLPRFGVGSSRQVSAHGSRPIA